MTALFARLAEPTDHDRDSEDDLAMRGAYDDLESLPCCGMPLRTFADDELEPVLCAGCTPIAERVCEVPGCRRGATHEIAVAGETANLCRRHTDRTCAHGTAVLNLGAAS